MNNLHLSTPTRPQGLGLATLALAFIGAAGMPLQAGPYYLVATTIQNANTKIDETSQSTWTFNVAQSFDLGGGALVMKDGPNSSLDLLLTLTDLTMSQVVDTFTLTNANFKAEVNTAQQGNGSNNDQGYSPIYFFFGATNFSATDVVSTVSPFTLVGGDSYELDLTSLEPDNSAYFIKGDSSNSYAFASDPSCTSGGSGCTSDLPVGSLSGAVGNVLADTSTPEPSSYLLLLSGFLFLYFTKRFAASRA
jgi:hypothetical protein